MAVMYATYYNLNWGWWHVYATVSLARSGVGDYGIYLFDAYDAGGDLKLHVRNRLNLFQTQKIQLWGAIPDGSEGLVTVRDEAGRDDEYVCVLMARGAYQQFEEYRYIPFTRIEYDPGY